MILKQVKFMRISKFGEHIAFQMDVSVYATEQSLDCF